MLTYHDGTFGLYFNGHDPDDVLKYRQEEYLPGYFEYLEYRNVGILMSPDELKAWSTDVGEELEKDRAHDGYAWT